MQPAACSKAPRKSRCAGQRPGEDRAVDAAVQHGERRVPVVREQPVERRKDAVPDRSHRLAAEEARLLRHDAAERVHECLLELLLGDRAEAPAADLAQVGPPLDLVLGRHDLGRLDRAGKVAREHAVEDRGLERLGCSGRLPPALGVQRHVVGRQRLAAVAEVRHRPMPHQVQPPSHSASSASVRRDAGSRELHEHRRHAALAPGVEPVGDPLAAARRARPRRRARRAPPRPRPVACRRGTAPGPASPRPRSRSARRGRCRSSRPCASPCRRRRARAPA